jgi:hypothetical protein
VAAAQNIHASAVAAAVAPTDHTLAAALLPHFQALATAAQVRPGVHFQVPPIAPWDGKTPGRRAHTFLKEIERLASLTSQTATDILFAHMAPDFQDHLEQVSAAHAKEGRAFTYELAKQAFLTLTGDVYERTADQMRLAFAQGSIKQADNQTLAQYRTVFDTNVRTAGGQ